LFSQLNHKCSSHLRPQVQRQEEILARNCLLRASSSGNSNIGGLQLRVASGICRLIADRLGRLCRIFARSPSEAQREPKAKPKPEAKANGQYKWGPSCESKLPADGFLWNRSHSKKRQEQLQHQRQPQPEQKNNAPFQFQSMNFKLCVRSFVSPQLPFVDIAPTSGPLPQPKSKPIPQNHTHAQTHRYVQTGKIRRRRIASLGFEAQRFSILILNNKVENGQKTRN